MNIESEYDFIESTVENADANIDDEDDDTDTDTGNIWEFLNKCYMNATVFVVSTVIYFYIWYHFGSDF